MRFKTETMEVERRGDGMDEVDFDSLSARVRRRTSNIRQQPHRYRGKDIGGVFTYCMLEALEKLEYYHKWDLGSYGIVLVLSRFYLYSIYNE